MDPSAPSRKRKHDPSQPVKSSARIMREKRLQQQSQRRPPMGGAIRSAKDSTEMTRIIRRGEGVSEGRSLSSPTWSEDADARPFTVANVGAGGLLYLKPTRAPLNQTQRPETPPVTADGPGRGRREGPDTRRSASSGTHTLRTVRGSFNDAGVPVPPLSLTNGDSRRRARSLSFSTLSDRERERNRTPTFDTYDFQYLLDGRESLPRRKSSIDLAYDLSSFKIPHYRLGTPRFSERGTAYLHSSVYTNSMISDLRSSTMSRPDYDKLFPAPPSKSMGLPASRNPISDTHLHPASTRYSRSTSRVSTGNMIAPAISTAASTNYDHVEANANDPSLVRYDSLTGQILAATPARLVAQITSPVFLDYELLSDFFLTYRCFLSASEVMELTLTRMKWALATASDCGRIVRVRTFVALRHWILNYFADDFSQDPALRRQFCDRINQFSRSLQKRPDTGSNLTDMNILEELKKCWRRTCAMFWSIPDAIEPQAGTDILPGGQPASLGHRISSVAFATGPEVPKQTADMGQTQALEVHDTDRESTRRTTVESFEAEFTCITGKKANIPASPMSEESLEVLSCSVPFLRHIQHTSIVGSKSAPRPLPMASHRNQPQTEVSKPCRPRHMHKRSGSFSDALRDHRTPLPSAKSETFDIRSLPAIALTGGLVRGLLLLPSPAKVESLIPITPAIDGNAARPAETDDTYFKERQPQNTSVKKIVGEVRRALSNRRRHDSPARSHRSTNSSSSLGPLMHTEKSKSKEFSMAHLRSTPSRMDFLGARAEESYKDAFNDMMAWPESSYMEPMRGISDVPEEHEDELRQPTLSTYDMNGLDSRLTEGSRSIMIGVDTAAIGVPMISSGLPSIDSMSSTMTPGPLFATEKRKDYFNFPIAEKLKSPSMPMAPPLTPEECPSRWTRASEPLLGAKLSMPPPWKEEHLGPERTPADWSQPREISDVRLSALDLTLVSSEASHKLRRRPGGDLKAADHVHDLDVPRPHTSGASFSTFSHSQGTSAVISKDLTGTQFSGQGIGSWRMLPPARKSQSFRLLQTHSSQPNLPASYQAQFARLAQLTPGLDDGGGGIEDTLLKLEGKIGSPTESSFSGMHSERSVGMAPLTRQHAKEQSIRLASLSTATDSYDRVVSPTGSTFTGMGSDQEFGMTPLTRQHAQEEFTRVRSGAFETQTFGPGDLDASMSPNVRGANAYNIPTSAGFLDFLTPVSMDARADFTPVETPGIPTPHVLLRASMADMLPMPPSSRRELPVTTEREAVIGGAGIVKHHANIPHTMSEPDNQPKSATTQSSFLLDENESLSDISTDIGAEHPGENDHGIRSFFFDDKVDEDGDSSHRPYQHPVTPPSTIAPPSDQSPERVTSRRRRLPADHNSKLKQAVSAPRMTAQQRPHLQKPLPVLYRHQTEIRQNTERPTTSSHMPFVLAFESGVIAEQLTIIEKDALDEIDWKDLVGLKWNQASPNVRNWADYLKQEDCNGIDIAIARFNLVVKWVVSECLLTESPSERARCITKYVHVATHCRRFRNFASMYQITVALLSADLARLQRTWALVSAADKMMLEQLERLCQPVRNFYNLRAEMESSSAEGGCIPFIGLYTHDLKVNAQRPAKIDAYPHGSEALVNFERYQTAAGVVKSLLRLIEASSKYLFHPHPEALSRCLWLAALEDEEISARSRVLEQQLPQQVFERE